MQKPTVTQEAEKAHGFAQLSICAVPYAVRWRTQVVYRGRETRQTTTKAGRLIVHPCGHSVAAESGSEAQSRRAHGEIAHQIPHEANELDDGRDEGEAGAVQLGSSAGHALAGEWGPPRRDADGELWSSRAALTYTEREVEGQGNGAKICSRKGQPGPGDQMLD